jgi:hypothetical protein
MQRLVGHHDWLRPSSQFVRYGHQTHRIAPRTLLGRLSARARRQPQEVRPVNVKRLHWAFYPSILLLASGAGVIAYYYSQPFRHSVIAATRCSRIAGETQNTRGINYSQFPNKVPPLQEQSTTRYYLLRSISPMKTTIMLCLNVIRGVPKEC